MNTSISKTIFISDLHLSEHQPELTNLFVSFVDQLVSNSSEKIDELYILGDFFNYWIGNDHYQLWQERISDALNRLAQTSKIYFLAGNRDFLVNQTTANKFHFKLLTKDHLNLNIYNNTVTVLHGDTLCTKDTSYQKYRKIVRNKLIQLLYTLLPLKLRLKLAQKIKQKSKDNNKSYQQDPAKFDVCEQAVKDLFKQMSSKLMIHGHTHKPKVHQYSYNDNLDHTRYVLGDWHKEGAYYLEVIKTPANPQAEFCLKYLNPL